MKKTLDSRQNKRKSNRKAEKFDMMNVDNEKINGKNKLIVIGATALALFILNTVMSFLQIYTLTF